MNTQQLFVEREGAESLDPRDDATSIVRSRLTGLLQERMRNPPPRGVPSPQPPAQPDVPQAQPASGAGRQPATGGRGPALTPITERSGTGETRTNTMGDNVSPPNWSLHGSSGTNSGVEPGTGAGNGILPQGSTLVKSPIEEEDETRPLGRPWDNNGASAAGNPEGGARPLSMALGATNVAGPGATGADPRPQDHQSMETQYNRASPPGHGPTNPSSTTTSGFTSISGHTATNTTNTGYSSPDMRLGTGIPEPSAVDLRGIDVEHRANPASNGYSYGAHPGHSPHESEKPNLTPIRTTALSPPPRGTEQPAAEQFVAPPGAQPAVQPAVTHPPGAQSFERHNAQVPESLRPTHTDIPPPASTLAVPSQPVAPQANRQSASSVEGSIPSEAAQWFLHHNGEDAGNLGLTGMNPSGPIPDRNRAWASSSEDEEEKEPAQKPWQQVQVSESFTYT